MKIKIAAVGKVKDRCVSEKVREYERRVGHDARLETVEIRDCGVESEGIKLREIIRRERTCAVVLSEEGVQYTSREFSDLLRTLAPRVLFVIGGPDGLSDAVKGEAKVLLSLSKMTFTHEMARLFLLEQIYRAISIHNNKKYHRD
ncbi:MAG: 23S rRNA (pseudouridine(1915)-N(3))-methyltransferase RlmH [Chitinispirillaceae bacterium]